MAGVVFAGARFLALGFRRRFLGHDPFAPVMTRRRDYRGLLCDLILTLGVAVKFPVRVRPVFLVSGFRTRRRVLPNMG